MDISRGRLALKLKKSFDFDKLLEGVNFNKKSITAYNIFLKLSK